MVDISNYFGNCGYRKAMVPELSVCGAVVKGERKLDWTTLQITCYETNSRTRLVNQYRCIAEGA